MKGACDRRVATNKVSAAAAATIHPDLIEAIGRSLNFLILILPHNCLRLPVANHFQCAAHELDVLGANGSPVSARTRLATAETVRLHRPLR